MPISSRNIPYLKFEKNAALIVFYLEFLNELRQMGNVYSTSRKCCSCCSLSSFLDVVVMSPEKKYFF